MELFKRSIILTKRFSRYGGDHDSVLALVESFDGVTYLYEDTDNSNPTMSSITTTKPYSDWLFDNYMDLMYLYKDDCPHIWWNDRHTLEGRKTEFCRIINSIK